MVGAPADHRRSFAMKLVNVAPAVVHQPGTWQLIYFNAPNRGEQVRMLFALARVPFVDVRLQYPEGLNPYKKAAMGDASPLLGTDQCPAVTAPDGTHCVETADVMRFVGQRVDLAPAAGSEQDAKAMETTLLAQSLMNKVFYGLLKPMVVNKIFSTQLLGMLSFSAPLLAGRRSSYLPQPQSALEDGLRQIEATLEASGGP